MKINLARLNVVHNYIREYEDSKKHIYTVHIQFTNSIFTKCVVTLNTSWAKEEWELLGQISSEIDKLQDLETELAMQEKRKGI